MRLAACGIGLARRSDARIRDRLPRSRRRGPNPPIDDHPTTILANLQPRYALSGHWEDFFQPISAEPQPIPLLDLDSYMQRAEAALPGRHTLAQPGARFVVPFEP